MQFPPDVVVQFLERGEVVLGERVEDVGGALHDRLAGELEEPPQPPRHAQRHVVARYDAVDGRAPVRWKDIS